MAWRWRHGEVGARDNAERRDESGPRPWFQVTPSSLVSLCLLGPLVPLVSAAPPDPSPLRARADRLASISAVSERPSSVPPALLTALRRRPSPSSLSARVPWIAVHRSLRASPSHHRSSRRPSPVPPPSPVAPIQHLALSASPHPIQP
ncbi:hypothetical protein M432DRAFT_641687 [Thermoascus aurantiacus ATCC 26904]